MNQAIPYEGKNSEDCSKLSYKKLACADVKLFLCDTDVCELVIG